MKILDRHILRAFLGPLIWCLLAFCLIFTVFDLFDHIGDFLDAKTPPLYILRYYLIFLPSLLYHILPVAVFLAVLHALYQLSKNNELTALRASGVSLHRVIVPLLAAGLITSGLLFVINEKFGHDARYWCDKFIQEQRRNDPLSAHLVRNLAFKKEKGQRVWHIATFDTRDSSLSGILITQLAKGGSGEVARITADGGAWLDQTWVFTNVIQQNLSPDGSPHGPPEVFAYRQMTELTEIPDDFLNEVKDPEYLSSADLDRYIRTHRKLDAKQIARLRTEYHARLAWPWTCLLVVMLGIPVGAYTGRSGVMTTIFYTLILLGLFLVLMFIGLHAGKNGWIPPLLGGWIPILTLLTAGTPILARLR